MLQGELSTRKRVTRSCCLAALRGVRAQKGAEIKQNRSKIQKFPQNAPCSLVGPSRAVPWPGEGTHHPPGCSPAPASVSPPVPCRAAWRPCPPHPRHRAQAGDAGAALAPRSTQGSTPAPAVPLSAGGAAWRGENFPAERRRPAASPLSPGVGTLRPVGRDRRRGFRSFLQQLVIDFSGRNIFAFRRPCHKPSASAREKQMES